MLARTVIPTRRGQFRAQHKQKVLATLVVAFKPKKPRRTFRCGRKQERNASTEHLVREPLARGVRAFGEQIKGRQRIRTSEGLEDRAHERAAVAIEQISNAARIDGKDRAFGRKRESSVVSARECSD